MIRIPHLGLLSVCGCVPARRVDNLAACAALVGEAKARAIVASTGFASRRVLEPGRTLLDLALPAAREALAGIASAEVGGVVVVSFSAPGRFPAVAARLQAALGLGEGIPAFDVQSACAGYPYGLLVAGQLAAATGRKVLLVDGDAQSAHVDGADVNTLAVMSDAATATVVSAGEGAAPASFAFLTDGTGAEVLACGADGTIRMDGFGVFRFVAGPVARFLGDVLAEAGRPELFVPHQANMYMVRQLARALGLEDRLLASGERFANPGSCSVPLTLAANGGSGRALLTGFGAGLAAAAACVEVPAGLRRALIEV